MFDKNKKNKKSKEELRRKIASKKREEEEWKAYDFLKAEKSDKSNASTSTVDSYKEKEEKDINIYKDFSIHTREEDDSNEEDEELSQKANNKEKSLVKSSYKKNKKPGKKSKKTKRGVIVKKIFLSILVLLVMAMVAITGAGVAIFKTDKWTITKEELLSESGATIYDKNGNLIATLTGDEINKKVNLDEMGKVPDAFISIEDERFYEHNGVDVKRTAAAIFNFIIHGGHSSFGGSTITQQLVKITMKDDSRSGVSGVQRKIREWSRAVQVEKMLSKDEILTRYLNRIFLGSASNGLEIRGVEAAANFYFNKSAKDLTVAESAFIAGINHAPNNYNPFNETDHDKTMEKIKTRTLTTVEKMHELGKINDEEYNAAKDEANNGLNFNKGEISNGSGNLSYHTAAAINQIAEEYSQAKDLSYSEAREIIVSSGYKIYTTVDQGLQDKMEDIFANKKYQAYGSVARGKKSSSKEERIAQSAMVLIEPSTGHIVAECGGLGEQNTLGFNRGTAKRQAGSSFKPLATIAPGLEQGIITASTLFNDVNGTSFGNYKVKNDDGGSHGICNMRYILTRSLNVPEVKLLSIMGTTPSAEFLDKIGIKVDPDNAGLSFALGSVTVSPVQMAAGYAMLANKGVYITPTFYTKVLNANDEEVMTAKQDSTRVMSEQNAYIETSLLQGPIKGGTASTFANYLGKMDVAGKTGTTDNYVDRWFCGYTPYYAAACWYGNDANNAAFYNSINGGGNPAGQIWFRVMQKVDEGLDAKSFEKPDGIVTKTICKDSGKVATASCHNTYTEIFNKDSIPGTCDGHSSVDVCTESGLLATEYCPNKESKVFGVVLDTEKNAKWSPKQEVTAAPTEKCNIHTSAPEIDVPNVVGKTQAEAEKILKNAGFVVQISKTEEKHTKGAKGTVAKQSTVKAPKGSTVVITIYNTDSAKEEQKNTVSSQNTVKPAEPPKNQNTVNATSN